MPYPVAYAVAAATEAFARLAGRAPDLTRQLVRASSLFSFVSSRKAERELGYTIRPLEESLRDTFRWFIARGRLAPRTPELRRLAEEPAAPAAT